MLSMAQVSGLDEVMSDARGRLERALATLPS
jgi:hypothetical protein